MKFEAEKLGKLEKMEVFVYDYIWLIMYDYIFSKVWNKVWIKLSKKKSRINLHLKI